MKKDPQLFPWDGRETFVLEMIPKLVALKPGLTLAVYRYAAWFASYPRSIRTWLVSEERMSEIHELDRVLSAAKWFPADDEIRPGDIRRWLTRHGEIEWDHVRDTVYPGPNCSGEIADADMLLILMLAMDAAMAHDQEIRAKEPRSKGDE